ncbi:MAG: trehalose 6-phosphate synthase [Nanoarchaeota archaeon]
MELKAFYALMDKTKKVKKRLVDNALSEKKTDKDLKLLVKYKAELEAMPRSRGKYIITSNGKKLLFDLSYELGELKKDIDYFEKGEERFIRKMTEKKKDINPEKESANVVKRLKKKVFNCFITDRDGTINNYCARYMSSVQSAYNAIFLTRFVKELVGHAIVVTSAPLDGIVSLSINQEDIFIYAGSKGREFLDEDGTKRTEAMTKEEKELIDLLEERIVKLLDKKEYQRFGYIGSGFQKKFGQITVARQDMSGSIPKKESEAFLKKITGLVRELDPEEKRLAIEDTDLDIEVILTTGKKKAFDKGDGINYIAKTLDLKLNKGINLVCGDTGSDIALAEKTLAKNKDTEVIFVTTDMKLKRKVKMVAPKAMFVSSPDTLIITFYKLANQ